MSTFTRRDWLKCTAALCASSVTPPCVFAVEPPTALPFAFSLYGMKTLTTADALKACADIGYDGVEMALMPGYPTEPKRLTNEDRRDLRQRLGDMGLSLVALMENLAEPGDDATHKMNLDRLATAAELGYALSPKSPPVIETILGGKPIQWEQVKDKVVERLRAWAKTAAASKIVIAVKPHVANALHTPEAATWLVKQIDSPWLKLAFDQSHFALRGLPLTKTTALLPDSVFVHVKDAKGTADKFEFLLPGDGTTDYSELFGALKTAKYRGPIVVEVSGQISNKPDYDPVAAAKRCYTNLAPALRKAELRAR